MIHELKTDSDVFGKVKSFEKTFEIHVNDRDFKEGDILKLRETVFTGEQMKKGMPLQYTGRIVFVSVTYIMKGPIYGLKDGWVIMSIKRHDH